jgi:hypothetical protein
MRHYTEFSCSLSEKWKHRRYLIVKIWESEKWILFSSDLLLALGMVSDFFFIRTMTLTHRLEITEKLFNIFSYFSIRRMSLTFLTKSTFHISCLLVRAVVAHLFVGSEWQARYSYTWRRRKTEVAVVVAHDLQRLPQYFVDLTAVAAGRVRKIIYFNKSKMNAFVCNNINMTDKQDQAAMGRRRHKFAWWTGIGVIVRHTRRRRRNVIRRWNNIR